MAVCAIGCAGTRDPDSGAVYRSLRPPVAATMIRDTPDLFILDLRRDEDFWGLQGHLRGAKNIPLAELEERLPELDGYRDRTFLVYCGTAECGSAGMAILQGAGIDHGMLIAGGIDAWLASGYETVGRAVPASEIETAETLTTAVLLDGEGAGDPGDRSVGEAGDAPGPGGGGAASTIPSEPGSESEPSGDGEEDDRLSWLLRPDREMALAQSAAPQAIARQASVLLLGPRGYRKVREGTNGFTCMVRRRHHPSDLQPICFDAEGSATILPVYQRRVELEMQGIDGLHIEQEIAHGFASGRYRAPSRPAVGYVLSREQRLYDVLSDATAAWYPHVLLCYPELTSPGGRRGGDHPRRRAPPVRHLRGRSRLVHGDRRRSRRDGVFDGSE